MALIVYIPIWLYSNMYQLIENPYKYGSLHSNMVIFKSRMALLNSNTTTFTFQYGYIQMGLIIGVGQDMEVYIPIWLYSNSFLSSPNP